MVHISLSILKGNWTCLIFVLFAVGHLSNVFFTVTMGTAVYRLILKNVSYFIFLTCSFHSIYSLLFYYTLHVIFLFFFPQFMWLALIFSAFDTLYLTCWSSTDWTFGVTSCSSGGALQSLHLLGLCWQGGTAPAQPSTVTGQIMCSDKKFFVALLLAHPLSPGVAFPGFSWHFLFWLRTAALQWRLLEEGETRYKHRGRSQS